MICHYICGRVLYPGFRDSVSMNSSILRFNFTCRRCGSVLEALGEQSGRHGRCPTCGALFVVPEVDRQTGLAAAPAEVAEDGQLPTPMHAYATAGEKAPKIKRLESGEQVIGCPRCGRNTSIDADSCGSCGLPFTIEGAAEVAQGGGEGNSMATAALVTGVLSLLTFCLPILGIVAIGLGVTALSRTRLRGRLHDGRKMAWAGIVCGAAALVAFTVWVFAKQLF